MLNGTYTGQYPVVERTAQWGRAIRLTRVERTLLDLPVRPMYLGGVQGAERMQTGKREVLRSRLGGNYHERQLHLSVPPSCGVLS